MRRARIGLLLAGIQVVLAIALFVVGLRQEPPVQQDLDRFVGPAIETSWAINAPVMFLESETIDLLRKAGMPFGSMSIVVCYLTGVGLFWFLLGFQIESRMHQREGRSRIVLDCLAISLGVCLPFFAWITWQQDSRTLAVGSVVWAFALLAFCGLDAVRYVAARRAA
jgi:hypothetical protein